MAIPAWVLLLASGCGPCRGITCSAPPSFDAGSSALDAPGAPALDAPGAPALDAPGAPDARSPDDASALDGGAVLIDASPSDGGAPVDAAASDVGAAALGGYVQIDSNEYGASLVGFFGDFTPDEFLRGEIDGCAAPRVAGACVLSTCVLSSRLIDAGALELTRRGEVIASAMPRPDNLYLGTNIGAESALSPEDPLILTGTGSPDTPFPPFRAELSAPNSAAFDVPDTLTSGADLFVDVDAADGRHSMVRVYTARRPGAPVIICTSADASVVVPRELLALLEPVDSLTVETSRFEEVRVREASSEVAVRAFTAASTTTVPVVDR